MLAFSPRHNLTLADLAPAEILPIIQTWTNIYIAHLDPSSPLAAAAAEHTNARKSNSPVVAPPRQQYRFMQIFENKGSAMGCSNPHPHGQIWTTTSLPEEPALELANLQAYWREHQGAHLLEDYARLESEKGERTVFENADFWAGCPWWAVWPFEILVVAKRPRRALVDFTPAEQAALADVLAEVTRRYDNLFETSFPYSKPCPTCPYPSFSHRQSLTIPIPGMGIHQAPLTGTPEEIEASHFHVHFYPPLLRSATVRKFLVGYEMMAEPQRDITPEQAARRLRDCGGELYRRKL